MIHLRVPCLRVSLAEEARLASCPVQIAANIPVGLASRWKFSPKFYLVAIYETYAKN